MGGKVSLDDGTGYLKMPCWIWKLIELEKKKYMVQERMDEVISRAKARNNTWYPHEKSYYQENKLTKMELTAEIDALYTKRLWGFDWLVHIEKLELE